MVATPLSSHRAAQGKAAKAPPPWRIMSPPAAIGMKNEYLIQWEGSSFPMCPTAWLQSTRPDSVAKESRTAWSLHLIVTLSGIFQCDHTIKFNCVADRPPNPTPVRPARQLPLHISMRRDWSMWLKRDSTKAIHGRGCIVVCKMILVLRENDDLSPLCQVSDVGIPEIRMLLQVRHPLL